MRPFIDFLSFTFARENRGWVPTSVRWRDLQLGLSGATFPDLAHRWFPSTLSPERGRFPYQVCYNSNETGARMFWHEKLEHVLVEAPGRACAMVQYPDEWVRVLSSGLAGITRLDVSVDIQCDTSPAEFMEAGVTGKFTYHRRDTSSTGESQYLGRRASDRHAVVYRFYSPHPRSDYLRVEHRFRHERAKQMAGHILAGGLENALVTCGRIFGWKHDLWKPSDLDWQPPPLVSGSLKDSDGIRWVLTQVIPALKRYEREGIIPDVWRFLADHWDQHAGD